MDRGKDDTGGKVLKQIADLHIHSRYSMATSKDGTPEMLDLWARKKGITLLGTGDMTHPIWRQELKAKLIPAEQGLFRLKDEYVLPEASRYPGKAPRFVLSGEISSIYKKGGKTRKVHSLILLPGFNEADAFAARLENDDFVDDNTLTVNVNRLRRKLEGIGLGGMIVTKKGLGYMVP